MVQSPQIEQSLLNTPIGVRARKKGFQGDVRQYNGPNKAKTAKDLEASDLRALNKIYIIGNQ